MTLWASLQSWRQVVVARAYGWATRGRLAPAIRGLLRLRGRSLISSVRPTGEASCESVILAPESPSTIVAPKLHDAAQALVGGHCPEVRAYVIRSAVLSAYSPGLLKGPVLYLPERLARGSNRVRTDGDGLFYYDGTTAIRAVVNARPISKAIHLGGAGAFNWYHFVVEILSKAYLCRRLPPKFDNHVLLVPKECQTIPNFASALSLFSSARTIVPLARGEYVQVEDLVSITDISEGPFNLSAGCWPITLDYRHNDRVLREFATEFRNLALGNSASGSGERRRIFLERPAVRRDYNQEEIVRIARKYGFVPYSPENHSLSDQAKAFSQAEMLVGPSGAAWVGMLFCTRPARFLSWLPPEYSQFCSYSSLAHLLGHQMNFVLVEPSEKLTSTADAYEVSYTLDPFIFERALSQMTKGH